MEALSERQQNRNIILVLLKELLSDLEYRLKIDIDVQQKVGEVIEAMKTHL